MTIYCGNEKDCEWYSKTEKGDRCKGKIDYDDEKGFSGVGWGGKSIICSITANLNFQWAQKTLLETIVNSSEKVLN